MIVGAAILLTTAHVTILATGGMADRTPTLRLPSLPALPLRRSWSAGPGASIGERWQLAS